MNINEILNDLHAHRERWITLTQDQVSSRVSAVIDYAIQYDPDSLRAAWNETLKNNQ